ncbi:MAG: glycoside hydrolase family 2 TIM barrel-domain containing protein [Candidatus Omnitrophota bacterium]
MKISVISLCLAFLLFSGGSARAGDGTSAAKDPAESSSTLITKSWQAHGSGDVEATFKYTGRCIELYSAEALKQQGSLKGMPSNKDEIQAVAVLNDVATAYFIQAESYMRQGKNDEAKKLFKTIIEKYPFAQAWDQRGWYWKIAQASEQSVKKIETGSIEIEEKKKVSQLPTVIELYDPGKEDVVDYEKYGEFTKTGTAEYKYIVKDQEGLSAAVGEGIYPNTTSIRWDPAYKKAQKEKRLEGSHWDYVHSPDLEAAFLKWATAPEPQGVKLFYLGLILEKSGLYKHALKCYYAIVVHFPGTYGWTYWHTPWYVGQAAIAKIKHILRNNPSLGYKLVGADIKILNGFDNDVSNDMAVTTPGKFVKTSSLDKVKGRLSDGRAPAVKKRLGCGKVHLVQYEDDGWQLIVEGKPYVIRAVTYAPTKIGQSPDEGTLGNWMEEDFNANGKIDGPYDAFVDKNRNNIRDANEPAVGDFKLMKDMGINTIRLYHHPKTINKELMRAMYKDYGIRVIVGDFLGKYAIGSGASWYPGTDYNDEEHKKKMMETVLGMVKEFKDEPYVLFWLLGNENVYGFACNADKEPEAFFKFANEVAGRIKEIDPEHPVAICSGDVLFLDKYGKNAPDVDIFGTNAYRGDYGFGFLWRQVKEETGKPAFITEYGCPAFSLGFSVEEAEKAQAEYHRGTWEDIEENMAFHEGEGNAIGGVIFEWLDEWWKAYEPSMHDTKGLFTGPFPDGFMHEEWLGICGQGDGKNSPFLRELRPAYFMYKKKWNR